MAIIGFLRGYIGIMEKKMETTKLYTEKASQVKTQKSTLSSKNDPKYICGLGSCFGASPAFMPYSSCLKMCMDLYSDGAGWAPASFRYHVSWAQNVGGLKYERELLYRDFVILRYRGLNTRRRYTTYISPRTNL